MYEKNLCIVSITRNDITQKVGSKLKKKSSFNKPRTQDTNILEVVEAEVAEIAEVTCYMSRVKQTMQPLGAMEPLNNFLKSSTNEFKDRF